MSKTLALSSAAVVLLLGSAAFGAVTVTPAAFANPDGTANSVDGGAISDGPITSVGARYQQVYSSALFGNFGGVAQSITQVQFRAGASENQFRPNSVTASNVIITLSTTSKSANGAGIADSYGLNVGSDVRTVYSGPITLDRGGSNAAGPQPFSYGFTLQTPFVYNPSMGNLLLDVSVPTGSSITFGPGFGALESFDATVDQPDLDGVASKNGEFGAVSTGLVTQFTTVAVPEPTTAAVALVATTLLGRRRRD